MKTNRDIFKDNLLETINEILFKNSIVSDKSLKFVIVPIQEKGKALTSNDDIMRLWVLSEKNLNNRIFDIEKTVKMLSCLDPLYPLWVNVMIKEVSEVSITFELQTSLRFRKPRETRNQETGHPPFKAIY